MGPKDVGPLIPSSKLQRTLILAVFPLLGHLPAQSSNGILRDQDSPAAPAHLHRRSAVEGRPETRCAGRDGAPTVFSEHGSRLEFETGLRPDMATRPDGSVSQVKLLIINILESHPAPPPRLRVSQLTSVRPSPLTDST